MMLMSSMDILILCLCTVKITGTYHKYKKITENIPWYQTQLLDYPALRYEVDFTVTFAEEKCCPILCLFINLPDIYSHVEHNCLSNLIVEGMVYWYKRTTFIFPNNTQNTGTCRLENGYFTCEIKSAMLNYEPKVRWLTLGYLCNEQKYLNGLQFEYTAKAQNTTQCEPLQTPPYNFQCDKFYNFVAFPNPFGHRSQAEAFTFIQMFDTLIRNMDHSCYKYLDYIVCQAFLPRCPNLVNNDSSELTVSHLDVICEEMCSEFRIACYDIMQPILNFVNCIYYRRTSELNVSCRHEHVFCDSPPLIKDGRVNIPSSGEYYDVGSTATYSCNDNYQLQGNSTSTCEYSGKWTPPPECNDMINIKIISASASAAVTSILALAITIYFFRRFKERKRRQKYFENQPLHKRNKENDAFVSYFSDGPDHIFVQQILQPKLEEESDPPFKLTLHIRDFRADMLIYVNILNAIKNSNCAIILISQEYIDSPWCREEFQVRIVHRTFHVSLLSFAMPHFHLHPKV